MQQKTPEEENLWLEDLYVEYKKLTTTQTDALSGILEGNLPVEEWLTLFATLPTLATAYIDYRTYRNQFPMKQPKLLPVADEPGFFTKLFSSAKAQQMQKQFDLDTRSNEHILNMFQEDADKNSQILSIDPLNMEKNIGNVMFFISTLKDDLKKGQAVSLKINQKDPQSILKDTKTKGASTIKVLRSDLMDISAKFADNTVIHIELYKEITEKSKYKPKTGNRTAKTEKIGYSFGLSASNTNYDVIDAPISAQASIVYLAKPTKHTFAFKLKEPLNIAPKTKLKEMLNNIAAKTSLPINDLKFSLGLIAQAYQRLKPKKA